MKKVSGKVDFAFEDSAETFHISLSFGGEPNTYDFVVIEKDPQ